MLPVFQVFLSLIIQQVYVFMLCFWSLGFYSEMYFYFDSILHKLLLWALWQKLNPTDPWNNTCC